MAAFDHYQKEDGRPHPPGNGAKASRNQTNREVSSGSGPPFSPHYSLNELVSSNPSPDFVVALEEQYLQLLAILRNDQLREIAVLRIEGYNIAEIAKKLAISQRAVERKLQLIRTKWKRELLDPDPGR